MTENIIQVTPKTPQELLISSLKKRVQIEHEGTVVELDIRPVTRLDRNQALELAVAEYQAAFDKAGFLPTVFEREIAYRVIAWSNLGPVKQFWPLLPAALGDKISKIIGVEEALATLKGAEAPEVVKAKN